MGSFSPLRVQRAIERDVPEAVAFAVVDVPYGPLAEDPYRVGKPFAQLEGYWSAHREPVPADPVTDLSVPGRKPCAYVACRPSDTG